MQMFKNLDHLIYINKHVYLLNFYISFIFFLLPRADNSTSVFYPEGRNMVGVFSIF